MKMYEELAEEKAEKENRELRRQPRERDHAGEQRKKVERVRQREEEGKILQCNEGKWEFHFDEESVKGSIILGLARFKALGLVADRSGHSSRLCVGRDQVQGVATEVTVGGERVAVDGQKIKGDEINAIVASTWSPI